MRNYLTWIDGVECTASNMRKLAELGDSTSVCSGDRSGYRRTRGPRATMTELDVAL